MSERSIRIEPAAASLDSYRKARGDVASDSADLASLLTDLMHFAGERGISFESSLRLASAQFRKDTEMAERKRYHIGFVTELPALLSGVIELSAVDATSDPQKLEPNELYRVFTEQNPEVTWAIKDGPESIDVSWIEP